MISLWDTTGTEVVQALAAERRSAGGVASGIALTLIVVVDEKRVREAEAAATVAAATCGTLFPRTTVACPASVVTFVVSESSLMQNSFVARTR